MGFLQEKLVKNAKAYEKVGEFQKAISIYEEIIGQYPKNIIAKNSISRLQSKLRYSIKEALAGIYKAYLSGELSTALLQVEKLTEQYPGLEPAWSLRGAIEMSTGKLESSEKAFLISSQLNPEGPDNYSNRGAVLERLGRYEDAIECFSTAIELSPNRSQYYLFRGNAIWTTGDYSEAEQDFRKCLEIDPTCVQASRSLAQCLLHLGRSDEAALALTEAIRRTPNDCDLRVDIAELYLDLGSIETARSHLEFAKSIDADSVRLCQSLGTFSISLSEHEDAIHYFRNALKYDRKNPALWNNLSSAEFAVGDYASACLSCEKALSINPDHANSLHNRANLYQIDGQLENAINYYEKALRIDPGKDAARVQKWHFQAQICDWSAWSEFDQNKDSVGLAGDIVSPWPLLAFEDAPERQLERSRRYAKQWKIERYAPVPKSDKLKLRIGLFSSDLFDHATLHLLNGVLEHHDRAAFEIFVYGLNAPCAGGEVTRLKRAVDHFVECHELADQDVVDRARQDSLDIAVDLKGYTMDARPALFRSGLAPVQINYLGYPGTLGTDAYDYVVADEMVVPAEQRDAFDEGIIYLPNCYQPNDSERIGIGPDPLRADHGLPEDAVVICCFNQSYKISPREFEIWMRVLKSNVNAVLWVLECNPWMKKNLCLEAERRGVAAERLIFAKRLPHAEHLVRHRLADVFADTFNVNAHTTASDALCNGLPVVTLAGSQFAARVAASLCHAAGLDDLIAGDAAEYEQILMRIVGNAEARTSFKKRLQNNLKSKPLLDIQTYTKHLEAGFRAAWDSWRNGQLPKIIRVENLTDTGSHSIRDSKTDIE